jgi:hypothetical protein
MEINWDEAGFPTLHYERIRSAKRRSVVAFGITGLLCLLGLLGAIFSYVPPLVAAFFAAIFVLFGLIWAIASFFDMTHYVQIIPYFQRPLTGIDTFLAGHTLVRFLNQLDRIAEQQNARTISSFGFADDLQGEQVVWHEPQVGLQTILAIQNAVRQSNVPQATARLLLADLSKWQQALERACAEQVLFCVLLRHGNSTSGHEWAVRQGSAF